MIDLLSISQGILRENSLTTRLLRLGTATIISFEDDALLGFIHLFETPAEMIENWAETEHSFLRAQATRFRAAGEKAWNVYSIFLCEMDGNSHEKRQIHWIEENLERTRKLASCGINTRADLLGALLPILTLQQRPKLDSDKFEDRLRRRVSQIAPGATDAVLEKAVNPTEVVRLLKERA